LTEVNHCPRQPTTFAIGFGLDVPTWAHGSTMAG
jgi:hypothetical protein